MIAHGQGRPVPGRRPVLLLDGRRRRQGRLDDVRRERRHDLAREAHAATTAAGVPPYYRRPATRGGPPTIIDLRNRRAPLPPQPAAPATACCGGCAPRSPSGPAAVHLRRATAAAATATIVWRRVAHERRPALRRSLGRARIASKRARPAAPKQHITSIKAPSKNPCFRCAEHTRASRRTRARDTGSPQQKLLHTDIVVVVIILGELASYRFPRLQTS